MINRNLARGLVLMGLALTFGIPSYQYQIGTFAHPGPGLFPFMVSVMLAVIAGSMLVKAHFEAPKYISLQFKNISIILGSLVTFAVISHFVNMTAGIVAMVFLSSFAATQFSWARSIKVALALVAIAFAFQKLLDLNLPLL